MSRHLIAIEPWSAAGPGWANSGLTLLWEDRATGKVSAETIYRDDLKGEALTLFPHLLGLYSAVRRECERGRAGKPR